MVQPTQSQTLQFTNEDGTKLLGLEGLSLVRVEQEQDGVRVVHVVTADETAAACPTCGVFSTARKGSATTRPRDVRYGPDPVRLVWHKSRWRCRESPGRRDDLEVDPVGPATATGQSRHQATRPDIRSSAYPAKP